MPASANGGGGTQAGGGRSPTGKCPECRQPPLHLVVSDRGGAPWFREEQTQGRVVHDICMLNVRLLLKLNDSMPTEGSRGSSAASSVRLPHPESPPPLPQKCIAVLAQLLN